MNPESVQQIAKAASALNWEAVGVLIVYLTIAFFFMFKFLYPLSKDRKDGKLGLSDESINSIASKINIRCQLGPGGVLSDLPDRLMNIRRLLEDIQSEVHTNHKGVDNVESKVDDVLDILSDLVRSIRQVVR